MSRIKLIIMLAVIVALAVTMSIMPGCTAAATTTTAAATTTTAAETTTAAAASTAGATKSAPQGLRIAYFVSTLNNGYHQADSAQATKYAKDKYGAIVTVMDGKSDNNVMAQNCDLVLANKFDMASVFVWNGDTVQDTIKQAMTDNHTVVNMFYQTVGNLQLPFIYAVESKASYAMGANVAKQWMSWYPDKPVKFAVIGWMNNPTVDKERTNPFIAGIKSVAPDAQQMAMLDGSGGTEMAHKAAQDLLQAHPDVNIIYGESSDLTIGIQAALKEAGRGVAVDGKCSTEIEVSTDATENEIKDIYNPTKSLKASMSMTPKDIAIARIDNLFDIYTGKVDQNKYVELDQYDKEIDYWNVKVADAVQFFNDQYMGKLVATDLGK